MWCSPNHNSWYILYSGNIYVNRATYQLFGNGTLTHKKCMLFDLFRKAWNKGKTLKQSKNLWWFLLHQFIYFFFIFWTTKDYIGCHFDIILKFSLLKVAFSDPILNCPSPLSWQNYLIVEPLYNVSSQNIRIFQRYILKIYGKYWNVLKPY